MATPQYNQGGYQRSGRPGGRGRSNDQPRYRPPQQQQILPQPLLAPRSQVPTLNPASAQRVLIHQTPYYLPQQISTTSAGGASFIHTPTPYQQIPQFAAAAAANPGLLPFNPQLFQQQLGATQYAAVPPGGQGTINLQLNPTTAPMAQAPAPAAALVSNPFTVPSQQPKTQPPTTKRASKAIKIVDPDTMAEVTLSSDKPNTSASEPVTTATQVSSQGGPLPPPHNGAPPHSDVAQDFKQKVQSTMNVDSKEFVPSQPFVQEPPRPNAIIRHPDEVKPDTGQVEGVVPVVNGVHTKPTEEVVKDKSKDEPVTPLEPTSSEPEDVKPVEVSKTVEPPPTEISPSVKPPATEVVTMETPPMEMGSVTTQETAEPLKPSSKSEPEPELVKPEPEPVKPEPENVKPEPELFNPELEPVKPEMEPVKPEPEQVKPEPKPVKSELEPAKSEPEPVKPELEPVKPEPEPVNLKPELVKPESKPVKPEPEPVRTEPEPTKPVHPVMDTEATPTESIPPSETVVEPQTEGKLEGVSKEEEVEPQAAVVVEDELSVEDDKPKKYGRSFLLSFAENKACQEPPAGLVKNLDVFLKDGGQILIKGPPVGMGFDGPRKGKGGGNMRRGAEPKRIIHQPLQTEKVELHKAEERWVRSQTVLSKLSEDKKQTADLYRKFQSILNKLTPQKFQKLAEQALLLEINTEERLKGCIDKIFTKALEEPSFSIAYANLCKVMSPLKVEWEEEGKPKHTNFRRELLTKCQAEFERDKKDDEEHDQKQKAVDEAATPEEKKQLEEELVVFTTKARKRSLGNIRFIGELFKLSMLSETIMHECIVRLLKSTSDEESLECFARLITTTGKELDSPKAKNRIDGYFTRISDIIKKGKIPARIKFMLQDVQELRRNEWVPRLNQTSTLKTIDQIHAEAKQKEEEDKRMAAQHHATTMAYTKGARVDDRRRASGATKEEWSNKGEKERAQREKPKMDRNRLAALKKDKKETTLGPPSFGPQRPGLQRYTVPQPSAAPQDSKDKKPSRSSSSGSKRGEKVPGGRGSGSGSRRGSQSTEQAAAVEAVVRLTNSTQGKPSHSQSQPTKPAPPPSPDALDEDTVRRKTGTIVDELTDNGDLKEAVECVVEMRSPGLIHVLVSESITHSLEKKLTVRKAAGTLMDRLVRDELLSEAKFMTGLNDVLEFADDLAMDVPKLWVYLAEILAPLFTHSTLSLSCLCGVPPPLVESSKAALLVAEVLGQCLKSLNSKDQVLTLWKAAKMDWSTLGVNSEDLAEFLTKQSLEFLLPRSSATPPVPTYYSDLAQLIANTDNTGDDIFDWVEKSGAVTNCKSSEFINALATAIVEATVSGSGSSAIYNSELFTTRAIILKKYVDEDTSLQVQVLYALQVAVTKLEHPPKMLNQMFNELYNIDLIVEDAFKHWKDQGTETYGKGNCIQTTNTFFEWLDSASVESDDGGAT